MAKPHTSDHRRAAEAFSRQLRDRFEGVIDTVLLFGSVSRGQERGETSDVDLLLVLDDSVDRADYEPAIRELAYDLELEHGVVLSVIVTDASTIDEGGPFFQHVTRDAVRLHG